MSKKCQKLDIFFKSFWQFFDIQMENFLEGQIVTKLDQMVASDGANCELRYIKITTICAPSCASLDQLGPIRQPWLEKNLLYSLTIHGSRKDSSSTFQTRLVVNKTSHHTKGLIYFKKLMFNSL